MRRTIGLLALALLLSAGLACSKGWSGSGSSNNGSQPGQGSPDVNEALRQEASAGGIQVDATWLTQSNLGDIHKDLSAYPLDRYILIEIAFTTHSGDLSKIDMKQASTLRPSGTPLNAEAWVAVSPDAHHRSGVLVFPRQAKDGGVELALQLGDGKDLSFKWPKMPA